MELEMLRKVIAEVLNVDLAPVVQVLVAREVNVEEAEKIVTVGDAVELIKKTVG